MVPLLLFAANPHAIAAAAGAAGRAGADAADGGVAATGAAATGAGTSVLRLPPLFLQQQQLPLPLLLLLLPLQLLLLSLSTPLLLTRPKCVTSAISDTTTLYPSKTLLSTPPVMPTSYFPASTRHA